MHAAMQRVMLETKTTTKCIYYVNKETKKIKKRSKCMDKNNNYNNIKLTDMFCF